MNEITPGVQTTEDIHKIIDGLFEVPFLRKYLKKQYKRGHTVYLTDEYGVVRVNPRIGRVFGRLDVAH